MTLPAFSIFNPSSQAQIQAYIAQGIPCKQGQWLPTDAIVVTGTDGPVPTLCCKPVTLWSDGSVCWMMIEGTVDIAANATVALTLSKALPGDVVIDSPVNETAEAVLISLDSGNCIAINKQAFLGMVVSETTLHSYLTYNNQQQRILAGTTGYEVVKSNSQAVLVKVNQAAEVLLTDDSKLIVSASITVLLKSGDIYVTASITNPAAAQHAQGQWDLGDPASIFLGEWGVAFSNLPPLQVALTPQSSPVKVAERGTATLYQASSGFSNWNSPVHVDCTNTMALSFCGYRWQAATERLEGEQAQPQVSVTTPQGNLVVEADAFWQNFPSSLVIADNDLSLSLLGSVLAPATELQPGEQKSRTFHITNTPKTAVTCALNSEWLAASRALPFYTQAQCSEPLHALIQRGITGSASFFEKRNQIDEFGWRHFGELYADHEKALSPDDAYFISHYNNQYDPIAGMLQQWLLTSDARWLTLADDLARHVADIDVYHTDLDKPEYSGGLFWHTDHYVQAYTATHRTYSKHQPRGVYDDHAGGGGPGGQHCYTHGLLQHYLMTGYAPSKKAMLAVCQWIERYYEGDGTLVSRLMAVKNRFDPGLKDIRSGRYPLDRGTGNYMQAMLDRYALLGKQSDLDRCAHIIYNTVSADDDIQQRNFANVEGTWFYTVFLQAVCRFITTKEQQQQNDASYAYAVNALTHYAKWMAEHEYAYLDKPDILEFPNQTWTAQDLRKVCVLEFAASYLSDPIRQQAQHKARSLLDTISERLASSKEAETTRVLCLMMQNYLYPGFKQAPNPMPLQQTYSEMDVLYRPGLGHSVWQTLRQFSFTKERSQLVKRFVQLQKWLGKP